MKFKLTLLIGFICFNNNLFSQILIPKKDYVPEVGLSRFSFAISLISGANSSPVSFGIMRQNPDSTHEIIFLTKESFILQASGYEQSLANPEKINFFEKNKLNPSILDEIWRLKHDVYPYGKSEEIGWGTMVGVPSKAQFGMLKEFGVEQMTDYAFGEHLWLLLIRLNDPLWTASYQLRKE